MPIRRRFVSALPLICLVLGLGAAPAPATAQPDPSGIDFVTIGAPGNAAYQAPDPRSFEHNRGSVAYEYKIGRYEATSGQWAEFLNAALNRPDPIPWVEVPIIWGGGQFAPFSVPESRSMFAAGGATWRTCAIFTNWLHNNKSLERAAFLSGAYDVSTFGGDANNNFTDQREHSPGARYWIPTMDEWLKAAHYDPHKQNPDGSVGGWWQYSNGTDSPYVYGPPPAGEANADFESPNPFFIPLGSYEITSPWGLYDVAGATREYTETVFPEGTRTLERIVRGSARVDPAGVRDRIDGGATSAPPGVHEYGLGFRIAAAVPAPSTGLVLLLAGLYCRRRKRRSDDDESTHSAASPLVAPLHHMRTGGTCPVHPRQRDGRGRYRAHS